MLTEIQTQRRSNPLLQREREFREAQKEKQANKDEVEGVKSEITTPALKTQNRPITLVDLQNEVVWMVVTYGQWEVCLTFR